MKKFIFALLTLTLVAAPQLSYSAPKNKETVCDALLSDPLSVAESFILQSSNRVQRYGALPKATPATYRLLLLDGELNADMSKNADEEGRIAELFATVLRRYRITLDDWKSVQNVQLGKGLALGTDAFDEALGKLDVTPEQRKILGTLNDIADTAREKLKTRLTAQEEQSLTTKHRFLSEDEINDFLKRLTSDPKYKLGDLITAPPGETALSEWRFRTLIGRKKLSKALMGDLFSEFKDYAAGSREIPETKTQLMEILAHRLQVTPADIEEFFGPRRLFADLDDFVEQTIQKFPSTFVAVIDRRIFTAQRTLDLAKAVRDAENVILFKLVENQDLTHFAEIETLAKELNAPIVVSPAFSETNLIISRLGFLFDREKHPNVHIMIDFSLQYSKDTYIINNGALDKVENPLVGLEQIYQPTDKLIVFHPRVLTKTTPSGYFASNPGWIMTTGSMSDPAYRSTFNVGMMTDARAQRAAEQNRGLLILSRSYKNEAVSPIVGGAYGVGARRAQWAQARYGNPEGLFDLNKIYTKDRVIQVKSIPGIVTSDFHLGITDATFQAAFFKALIQLGVLAKNPNYGRPGELEYVRGPVHLATLVLQELVDGTPNNAHILDRLITRAVITNDGLMDFRNHFKSAAAFATQIARLLPDTMIVIPADNHGHDWLAKRLQNGDLKSVPPGELAIVLRMMYEAIEKGGNPYARALQRYGIATDNIIFASPDDQYRMAIDISNPERFALLQGVEGAQHGQYGANGAKSISLKGMLAAYAANVHGHYHSTAEMGLSKRLGTGTPIPQDYQSGPSGSDSSLGTVYSLEAVQILRLVRGTFIPNAEQVQPAEDFYPTNEFPLVRPWPSAADGGATDQYRANPPKPSFRR